MESGHLRPNPVTETTREPELLARPDTETGLVAIGVVAPSRNTGERDIGMALPDSACVDGRKRTAKAGIPDIGRP
jgi:hypothetical protein